MKFNNNILVLLCALFYTYPSQAAQKSYVLDKDYFGCCHQYGEIRCGGKEANGENDSTCYYVENMDTAYEKSVVMNGIAFTYAYPSQRSNIANPFNPNNKEIVYWIGFKNGKKNGVEIHYEHDYEQRKYKDWEQTWENGELLNRKEFYQNGKLSEEISYKNSVKNGSYIVYYPNGKPKIKLDYKDDKLVDGEWKKYGITDKELILGMTKDGRREGLWKQQKSGF